jgi:pSer/pThr/pTyr-binding forkhead associated (FHA) protein
MAKDPDDQNLRIPDSLWEQLVQMARERGTDPQAFALLALAEAVTNVDPGPAPRLALVEDDPAPTSRRRLTVQVGNVEHVITRKRFLIGRGEECHLRLNNESVDLQHAIVEIIDDDAFLVDMATTSGTYYGKERILRKAIADGDSFRLGASELSFRIR